MSMIGMTLNLQTHTLGTFICAFTMLFCQICEITRNLEKIRTKMSNITQLVQKLIPQKYPFNANTNLPRLLRLLKVTGAIGPFSILPVQTRWLLDCRYVGGVDGPQDYVVEHLMSFINDQIRFKIATPGAMTDRHIHTAGLPC